jgi:hypothetical protein
MRIVLLSEGPLGSRTAFPQIRKSSLPHTNTEALDARAHHAAMELLLLLRLQLPQSRSIVQTLAQLAPLVGSKSAMHPVTRGGVVPLVVTPTAPPAIATVRDHQPDPCVLRIKFIFNVPALPLGPIACFDAVRHPSIRPSAPESIEKWRGVFAFGY